MGNEKVNKDCGSWSSGGLVLRTGFQRKDILQTGLHADIYLESTII